MASMNSPDALNWQGQDAAPSSDANPLEMSTKAVGLKVHYTFSTEGHLARGETIQVPTVTIDERTTLGVVDLSLCLNAIIKGSPELNRAENDYSVYWHDYSEPDAPLVGSGLLSTLVDNVSSVKKITGKVSRDPLAMISGGVANVLVVRLKLNPVPRAAPRPDQYGGGMMGSAQAGRTVDTTPMSPAAVAEWMSGTTNQAFSRGQSPGMGSVYSYASSFGPAPNTANIVGQQSGCHPLQQTQTQPMSPSPAPSFATPVDGVSNSTPLVDDGAPKSKTPINPPKLALAKKKGKGPTGRPRGRPPKRSGAGGSTSGYEDGTDGDEPPMPSRKRARVTATAKPASNPFARDPGSLRVAASTSGSLRSFRPLAAQTGGNAAVGPEMVPRAPTPVPSPTLGRGGRPIKPRGASKLHNQELAPALPSSTPFSRPSSPADSASFVPQLSDMAPSDAAPEYPDSSAEIGSSPPISGAMAGSFAQSSPPPSSPATLRPVKPRGLANAIADSADEMEVDLSPRSARAARRREAPPPPPPHPMPPIIQECRDRSSVPVQVFQIHGNNPEDWVQIRSYNSPQPALPPLKGVGPPFKRRAAPQTQPKASQQSRLAPIPSAVPLQQSNNEQPPRQAPKNPTAPPLPPQLPVAPQPCAQSSNHANQEAPIATPPPTDAAGEDPFVLIRPTPRSCFESKSPSRVTDGPEQMVQSDVGPTSTATETTSPPVSTMAPTADSTTAPPPADSSNHSSLALPMPVLQPLPLPQTSPAPRPDTADGSALPPTEPPQQPMFHQSHFAPQPGTKPLSMDLAPLNKNQIKKLTIKHKLEEAIRNGTRPPFCSNCGAIETPTWRKIWTQDRTGIPPFTEYSEKMGHVTAIDILQRDEDQNITSYRMIKKNLGHDDIKAEWTEALLCNPCGIWLSKCKSYRPRDMWDRDQKRLGQERRKRGSGPTPRGKKARTPAKESAGIDSDSCLLTDGIFDRPSSPGQQQQPPQELDGEAQMMANFVLTSESAQNKTKNELMMASTPPSPRSKHISRSRSMSSHAGTVDSPIAIDDEDFVRIPDSPVQPDLSRAQSVATGDAQPDQQVTTVPVGAAVEETVLPKSPVLRPSTPQPTDSASNPPSSHRPITRSISRTLRGSDHDFIDPNLYLTTPTKGPRSTPRTPRSRTSMLLDEELGTPSLRRSPRFQHNTDGLAQSYSGRMASLTSSAKSNRIRSVPSSATKHSGAENLDPTTGLGINFLDAYTDEQFMDVLKTMEMDASDGGVVDNSLAQLDLDSAEFDRLFGGNNFGTGGGDWAWDGGGDVFGEDGLLDGADA